MPNINLLEQKSLNAFLLQAMYRHSKGRVIEFFNLSEQHPAEEVELKMQVNGKEIDIIPELYNFIEALDDAFDEAVERKAKELIIQDRALMDLANAVRSAEWAIQDRLDKITQRP